ncbi:hypothetical protein F959_01264 [Acinetobacter venetianus RAG-1 = CIP 110063]|uniref:Uncharacterized protein n=1 Tax=Acinetobacter venetianus (strain ATCC 31012 / DSM 23050 / BCRC 14357 / CCUG 45561 / CIP 110063 / KCTC 2702 / LMG 19082 / RAG-1) TaxID=1191460 RepID=N8ZVE5_ACIVR|nr:hypothetical protein [Acinetobacter venetianus]ENV37744.1 hypothetical protein F959_01264 [Acinetobacter venetianus RAG-1 = CIP 110063]
MKIEQTDFESQQFESYHELMIVPELIENEQSIYSSSSISFYKYAKNQVNLNYIRKPDIILEQRSIDWFGPTLLITTAALTQNPELVSITLNVISNYITDFFKGRQEPDIKISLLIQQSTTKFKKLDYEGNKDGLKEIEKLIKQLKD